METERRQTAEESFRGSLDDVIAVVTKLAPLCANFDELLSLLHAARENDAQIRLLMIAVAGKR